MTKDGLKHLAAFLPEFERLGFKSGESCGGDEIEPGVLSMPFVAYSDVVSAFVDSAYQRGWVLENFDWNTWAASSEAMQLLNREDAVEHATAEQLGRLLTTCIRQDRFVDGALLEAFDSGLMLRIVRRAAALIDGCSSRGRE